MELGVKYRYENLLNGFRFTFERPHEKNKVHDLSALEKQILSILKEDGTMTFIQISKVVGKSVKTVYRAVKKLKENGVIRRIGNESDCYWEIL